MTGVQTCALPIFCGVLFIALLGWRLLPRRKEQDAGEGLFEIEDYLTELRVPPQSKFLGRTLHDLVAAVAEEADLLVVALLRAGERRELPSAYEVLKEEDILLVEADSEGLKRFLDVTGLELAEGANREEGKTGPGDLDLAEAIVTPGSILVGKTATALDLRERYGINMIAVARQGRRLRERLGKIRFAAGDILLLQAREESLPAALGELGCLPLASRGLRIGKPRNVLLAGGILDRKSVV